MVDVRRIPLVGDDADVDDPRGRIHPRRRDRCRHAVDRGALRRRHGELLLSAREPLEDAQNVLVERAGEPAAAELRLPRRARHRDRIGPVLHQIAGRDAELDPEVGVGEGRPVDDALGRVVVDIHSVDLREVAVAVADARAQPSCRARLLQRALGAVLAQRMGARPFRRLAVAAPLQALLERGRSAQRSEDTRAPGRIIARRGKVALGKRVGLIFLLAREAEGPQSGLLRDIVRDRGAAENRADDLSEHAERIALRILLADVGMVGGDMRGLVAEREGELGLVVDDAHQLASDVDIAAGDGEGVLDRRINRRVMERLPRVRHAGDRADPAADELDIGRARTGLGPAQFLHDGGMLALSLGDVARVEVACAGLGADERRTDGDRRGGGQQDAFAHDSTLRTGPK